MHPAPHLLTVFALGASSAFARQLAPLPAVPEARLTFDEANALAAHPRWLSLKFGEFDTRSPAPAVPADLVARSERDGGRGYFLAQFDGAISAAVRESVQATGAELLDYVPNYAFVVRATNEQRTAVARLAATVWTGEFPPAYRLDARLLAASQDATLASTPRRVVVVAFEGVERATIDAQLASLGLGASEANDANGRWMFVVEAAPRLARRIAALHDVQWVEPEDALELRNNTMVWTVQTFVSGNTKLWTNNINGTGQIVGHIDGDIALSSCYFADPASNPIGPSHRKIVYNSGTSTDSHGTHTAVGSPGTELEFAL